jgi:hypothetical protein
MLTIFFVVIVLGIVVGAVLAIPLGIATALAKRECPHCRERINKRATVCTKCQRDVVPIIKDKQSPSPGETTVETEILLDEQSAMFEGKRSSFGNVQRQKSSAKTPIWKLVAWAVGVFVLIMAVIMWRVQEQSRHPIIISSSPEGRTESSLSGNTDSEIEDMMKTFRQAGIIKKMDPALREVQVDVAVWRLLPFEQKKQAAAILSESIARGVGLKHPHVTILDSMTGRELASYDAVYGYVAKD